MARLTQIHRQHCRACDPTSSRAHATPAHATSPNRLQWRRPGGGGGAKVDHPHRRGSCDAGGKRSSGGAMATKSPPQPILTATGADFDRHRRCPHHAPQPPLPSLLPRSLAPFHLPRSRSRSRRPRERLVIGGRARLAGQKSDAGTPGTAPAIARGQSLIIRHRAHHTALPRSAPAPEFLTRGIPVAPGVHVLLGLVTWLGVLRLLPNFPVVACGGNLMWLRLAMEFASASSITSTQN
jgi:hypothetical protein